MNRLACPKAQKGTIPQREEAAEIWMAQRKEHSLQHRISHPAYHVIAFESQSVYGAKI